MNLYGMNIELLLLINVSIYLILLFMFQLSFMIYESMYFITEFEFEF
jgi:hypothetical protein